MAFFARVVKLECLCDSAPRKAIDLGALGRVFLDLGVFSGFLRGWETQVLDLSLPFSKYLLGGPPLLQSCFGFRDLT